MDYLQKLNPQQKEAVLYTEGPLMIVAGAGSGKTSVLTTRIAHLIQKGVSPFNILALTFTNKAAAEMKERIEHILQNAQARNLFIGTFHSVFAKILRFEADKLGYPKNFTIYDADDSKSVLRQIIKELNLDDKLYKTNILYGKISGAKNNLISPADYAQDKHIQQEDAFAKRPAIAQVYLEYVKKCFRNGAMDFDDILLNMFLLLRKFPEVLARYQHKFKYVLVDEYQDTNKVQYFIVKLLAAVNENICVVGDDAQSIYSFRGADIENIFQFQKDYADVKIIKLEQNYRSTKTILQAANTIININQNQIPKNLWTENEQGEKIKLLHAATDNDEGKLVADAIIENKFKHHYQNKDFAILYRTNAQSRSFEENLRRLGIPYRIYGGLSFYQRKEIKDMVCYLRAVVNPNDEEAIKRIINTPARGIGNTTLQKITLQANELEISFWDALQQSNNLGIKGATLTAISNFIILIKNFQAQLAKQNAYQIATQLAKESTLMQDLNADKTVEGLARIENLNELLNSIKEFTETPNEDGELENKNLGEYLQQITLLTDADKDGDDQDNDKVKLMTIHAAKGLEFPCVFAVGLEENIFPSSMSIYDNKDIEEERRLFYVVLTRAKQLLWITLAQNRYRFGSLISNQASRFLDELPTDTYISNKTQISQRQLFTPKPLQQKPQAGGAEKVFTQRKINGENNAATHVPSAQFTPAMPNQIEVGMRVEHQRFGFGIIKEIEGGEKDKKAVIIFEKGIGEKLMMLNFAKLSIAPNP